MANKGVAAVKVEVIARQLQVSKGSFQWHFKNRIELLEEILQRWENETFWLIEESQKEPTPKQQLIKLFIKWIKITNKTNYFQTIFLTENLDSLLKYFNFLVKILVKYQIFSNDYLSQRTLRSKTNNLEQFQEQNNYFKILFL